METKVRVGVRVRPLLPNERAVGSEMVVKYPGDKQIGMGERAFTYDHVFGPQVAQGKLYELTARPMLKPFLEGYNVTIIAYGQTGSGKTYTMGSEATSDYCGDGATASSPQGLIPRFVEDLFAHLQHHQQQQQQPADSQGQQQQREANVTASFLEIYGEDVYDLLEDSAAADASCRRTSLPIREDAAQGVIVQGLKQVPVASRGEALQVLRKGTTNRTTAATLMNVVSSRSHAVFTITLQQVINPTASAATTSEPAAAPTAAAAAAAVAGAGGGGSGEEEEGEGQVVVSKLTFVDLAGSERLKRTGAEGERRREGIQINVGLLALGSVINALADEERLLKGKRVHVPYRQSKLTRLLQDALGGNSQTLFLACVSPADINASETLSTLYYANRARNIRNKPVKNTDSVKEELRCLRQTAAFLKAEMVRLMFAPQGSSSGDSHSPPAPGADPPHAQQQQQQQQQQQLQAELMERPEVKAFLEQLGTRLDSHLRRVGIEGVDGPGLLLRPLAPATPGANRYSYGGFGAAFNRAAHPPLPSAASSSPAPLLLQDGVAGPPERLPGNERVGTRLDFDAATALAPEGEQLLLQGQEGKKEEEEQEEEGEEMVVGDPEKELAILAKLRELQQHEAQAGEEAARGQEELANVEGEMEQKEGLLEQLRQTLEGYHGMRGRYERLLREVEALEGEKEDLHRQLEQAVLAEQQEHQQRQQLERQQQRGGGNNPAAASAAAAALREKLKGVEAQLDRLRVQKKQQEGLQRLAERQRQELKALEENLGKLKATKAQLMKRQREAAKRHEQLIGQKRREVEALRKSDRTLQKKVGRLQLEARSHKLLLDRKDHCIRTLKEKAAKAETHVTRLLQLQNRSREASALHRRTTAAASGAGSNSRAANRNTPCCRRLPPSGPKSSVPPAAAGAVAFPPGVNGEKVEAARFLLEKVVEERLAELEARRQLEHKTRDYEALVTELRAQAAALERLKAEGAEEGEEGEVEEAIREAEARLEGLDVEMELCANAIGGLQVLLEAAEQQQPERSSQPQDGKKKGAAAVNQGLNEEAALTAVSELGAGEARALLAGLVDGMVEARARAWELETEAKKRASAEEGLRLDKRRLERRLSESARGFEQRLTDLRSQHQKDLITLVRGGGGESAARGKGARPSQQQQGEGGKAEEEDDDDDDAAANEADEVAKRQLEALAVQNDALEVRCQGLSTELQVKAAEAARLEEEAAAARREARELRAAMAALKQSSGQGQDGEEAMEELLAAWAELGLSDERRDGLLGSVKAAPRTACQRLLDEARGQRDEARARVAALRVHLRLLTEALGLPAVAAGEEGVEEGGKDLLVLCEKLGGEEAGLRVLLQERVEAAQRLAGEAQRLQSSVGPDLEKEEQQQQQEGRGRANADADAGAKRKEAALAGLQRLYEGMGWGREDEGETQQQEEDAAIAAARALTGQGLPPLSEASLKAWEEAVKGLRVTRADLLLQLQDALERARGACALLGMDTGALAATLRAALAREARHSSSSSSPPSKPHEPPAEGPQRRRRQRGAISPLPPSLRMDDAALRRIVGALATDGQRAVTAGLWAEEVGGAGATLREALLQARFVVEVGAECWDRRRELLGLCRAAAAGVAEAFGAAASAGEEAGGEGKDEEEEEEERAKTLQAAMAAVRAAVPGQEEEGEGDGQEEDGGETDSSSSSSSAGICEAEAEAFVGAVEGLLADVEADRGAAKAALEALWDYFQVPPEGRNASVLERQHSASPMAEGEGEAKEEREEEEELEGADALMRIKAAVACAEAPAKARGGDIEAWVGRTLERLRQALQALRTALETGAALRGQVAVLADRKRRQESILRLDREIAALEAEFKAFEERAKRDKGRLTNRKATSVGLLKEEQFRKGSQARARALLTRLKQELTEWVAREGRPFDAALLGADLQQLFQVAQESGSGDWERARTELMHLCTQAPLGPGGGRQRRRSSPTAGVSPEMPRVSPTPSSDDGSSSSGSSAAGEQQPVVEAAPPAPQKQQQQPAPETAAGSKRDPFARVLSPTDAALGVGSGLPLPAVSGGGMVGIPGLNRLANAGTLSDMLVRGTSIPTTAATAAAAVPEQEQQQQQKPGAVLGGRKDGATKENEAAKNE